MLVRKPCVAGKFYPGDEKTLKASVDNFLSHSPKETAKAIIAPHAGYVYSGGVAGFIYSCVHMPDDVILIGPNHTGLGKKVSVMAQGAWDMPLGKVNINKELAEEVISSSALFSKDNEAHLLEHSLEVQLPFIYSLNKASRIVPITVMQATIAQCAEMGKAIAGVISNYGKEVLIVVSSDMNHYESEAATRAKDRLAIDKVLKLDYAGLIRIADENDISMCGLLPTAIAIAAVKALGGVEGRLVKYSTSGEVNGDYSQVVGYAGMLLK
ncbi:MAG: AmmeMemoRadiSam system protein B [Deltaproteobacteria bacterium]|nr:AmmeMemoRadiSam system protein B [Deltaproteobacteria bacterium]